MRITLKATLVMIEMFENQLNDYLASGMTVEAAVQAAYIRYPIMLALLDEVKKQIEMAFHNGYGDTLPHGFREELTRSWAADGLTLSERTTRSVPLIQEMVAKTVKKAIDDGETYKSLAIQLFDGYRRGGIIPEQSIPEFMKKLHYLSTVKRYNREGFAKKVRRVELYVKQLKTPALRIAYKKLVAAIDAENEYKLKKAVHVATQERTRYFAERIARTEIARAQNAGVYEKYVDNDDCIGFRWRLSSAHPVYDICDMYANADLYGLGPGIYPKDKLPMMPAHPNCMCHIQPVFTGQLAEEKARNQVKVGGMEYIDSLSSRRQEKLLGVYGRQLYLEGTDWRKLARGYSTKTFKSGDSA